MFKSNRRAENINLLCYLLADTFMKQHKKMKIKKQVSLIVPSKTALVLNMEGLWLS